MEQHRSDFVVVQSQPAQAITPVRAATAPALFENNQHNKLITSKNHNPDPSLSQVLCLFLVFCFVFCFLFLCCLFRFAFVAHCSYYSSRVCVCLSSVWVWYVCASGVRVSWMCEWVFCLFLFFVFVLVYGFWFLFLFCFFRFDFVVARCSYYSRTCVCLSAACLRACVRACVSGVRVSWMSQCMFYLFYFFWFLIFIFVYLLLSCWFRSSALLLRTARAIVSALAQSLCVVCACVHHECGMCAWLFCLFLIFRFCFWFCFDSVFCRDEFVLCSWYGRGVFVVWCGARARGLRVIDVFVVCSYLYPWC